MYTHFVKTGIITMEKLIELMVINPRKRFGLEIKNDFSVWKLDEEYTVNPEEFVSMGKATPFEGEKLFAQCLLTVKDDNVIYMKNSGGIK
jgi:dihydroorotase